MSGQGGVIDGKGYYLAVDAQIKSETAAPTVGKGPGPAGPSRDLIGMVGMAEVQQLLAKSLGRRLLFIDTDNTVSALGNSGIDNVSAEQIGILAAASPDQHAYELSNLGHGAFTYAVLEGLSGKLNDPTGISVRNLADYVGPRVRQLTEGKQTPLLLVNFGDFMLGNPP